jgi:hypothetical protein
MSGFDAALLIDQVDRAATEPDLFRCINPPPTRVIAQLDSAAATALRGCGDAQSGDQIAVVTDDPSPPLHNWRG